jgi:hypothetical protein
VRIAQRYRALGLGAEARAHRLLARNIPSAALKSLRRDGVLRVRGGKTGALYEISESGAVRIVGVCRLCVTLDRFVPDSDAILAMALYIQHDEARFLTVANCFAVVRPERVVELWRKARAGDPAYCPGWML